MAFPRLLNKGPTFSLCSGPRISPRCLLPGIKEGPGPLVPARALTCCWKRSNRMGDRKTHTACVGHNHFRLTLPATLKTGHCYYPRFADEETEAQEVEWLGKAGI